MLIFDQLRKNDPQLRLVTLAMLAGLGVLAAGLWWVQVVSARDYQEHLETQSFRTVRIPAVRGKILDRNGTTLAESRPTYNVSLYLDELRNEFQAEYSRERSFRLATNANHFWERWLGSPSVRTQYVRLRKDQIEALKRQARYHVASNVVAQISERLQQPVSLNPTNFQRHYDTRLALPFPVLTNVSALQIARFEEECISPKGVDIEVLSTRVYPFETTAAHVLGWLQHDDSSAEGEEAFVSYRLPDFRGLVGVERGYDRELRGTAGVKSVLVNSLGYRQTENVWSAAEPGHNVVLTLDLRLQQAAEQALASAPVSYAAPVRGAVVVMDAQTGDILAMASSPTLNPNYFVQGFPRGAWQHITESRAERNRATQDNYMPGSVFKTVVGMAGLESGLNPEEKYKVEPNPAQPDRGCYRFRDGSVLRDTAPSGYYNFRRAIIFSSNSYFANVALRTPLERIIALGQRLHLGETTGLTTRQETGGQFPADLSGLRYRWTDRKTANMAIGQDPVWVTPLQIAVLTSAIANGGKVLWPRLVDRIEPSSAAAGDVAVVFPRGRVRDELGVSLRTMNILHEAMLAETEDPEGTGHPAARLAPGLRICGKTGTAQIQDERNAKTGQTTWFASFAPYEKPRYTVVVMVEDGTSGGTSCAPVAGKIYAAILEREHLHPPQSLARSN